MGLIARLVRKAALMLSAVADNRGGWWPWLREPYSGAWQKNDEWTADTVLAHHAVFTCVTLIASDVAKLRPKLMQKDADDIWRETTSPAFSPVLRKPNGYQNRIQFIENWMLSKLIRGNSYVLKERDERGVVVRLYVLDPSRVMPMVAPDGSVFYQLQADNLSGLEEGSPMAPASEIIHDRSNCLFHPLIGVSPIFAAGTAANIGLKIEKNASAFFGNGSNPSGILTAPGTIDEPTAKVLSDRWNKMYSGDRSGRVAVLGNGLKFEAMRMTAVESQMIETLGWTARTVANVFHVPAFKIGIGDMPTYQNGETLNQIYYTDCLQSHIEQFELAMDEGLGLDVPKDGKVYGVEMDLDALLRMDSATQIKSLTEGVKGGLFTPNEARKKVDQRPLEGGDTVYMQEQNFSLAALNKRDTGEDPFGKSSPAPSPAPAQADNADPDERAVQGVLAVRFRTLTKRKRANNERRRAA